MKITDCVVRESPFAFHKHPFFFSASSTYFHIPCVCDDFFFRAALSGQQIEWDMMDVSKGGKLTFFNFIDTFNLLLCQLNIYNDPAFVLNLHDAWFSATCRFCFNFICDGCNLMRQQKPMIRFKSWNRWKRNRDRHF